MPLAILVFSGGLIYWTGLVANQRVVSGAGVAALVLVLLLMLDSGAIDPFAIPLLATGGLLFLALKRYQAPLWQFIGWTVFAALTLALGLRVLPFFTPVATLQTVEHLYRFPPEKIVLMLLVPAMVLVPWPASKHSGPPGRPGLKAVLVLTATLAVLIPIALLSGFIEPGRAPQSAAYLGYGLAYNLIYTCILDQNGRPD
jgi:hypothetical protein